MKHMFWQWLTWMEEIGPCWPKADMLVELAFYLTD